jgi:hypothetical protein
VPRSLRSVRLISVDLGIDDHHSGKLLKLTCRAGAL